MVASHRRTKGVLQTMIEVEHPTVDVENEDAKTQEIITLDEAAELLRISRSKLYQNIQRDLVPGVIRLGKDGRGGIRIHRDTMIQGLLRGATR